jgi:hypothetical protein
MKVIDSQSSVNFNSNTALSPADINDVFLYAKDAVSDVGEKRYAIAAISFPFVQDMSTGLTNASTLQARRHRFICPVDCTVVRAFLEGSVTAAAAMTVDITTSGGSTPSGATVPYLNVDAGATTAADVEDINIQAVTLDAGVTYNLTMSGTSFTTERCNVVLHVLVDRWRATGALDVPTFVYTDLVDSDGTSDADKVNAASAALAVESAKFTRRAMSPSLNVRTGFTSATAAADLLCSIPAPSDSRCASRIVRAYLSSATAATGQVVTATIRDETGTTIATLSNNHAASTLMTADSGVLADDWDGSVATIGDDYSVTFSASTGVVVERAALILWTEW